MQRFTELRVWQRSHASVLVIYRMTEHFPPEERYGLTSQLRRAALGSDKYCRRIQADQPTRLR